MSPDRKPHFPRLQQAADEAERKKAEAARKKAAEENHADAGHGGHDEHDPIAEAHLQAREHLERSEFPGLVKEMSDLHDKLGRSMVSVEDGWYYRLTLDKKGLFYPAIELNPKTKSIGVNWEIKSEHTLGFGRFSKTFKSQDVLGLFIVAYQTGNILIYGAETQVLTPAQWDGNPDVQAEALNRAFENPFSAVPMDK